MPWYICNLSEPRKKTSIGEEKSLLPQKPGSVKGETPLLRDQAGGNEERDSGVKIVFILALLKEFLRFITWQRDLFG